MRTSLNDTNQVNQIQQQDPQPQQQLLEIQQQATARPQVSSNDDALTSLDLHHKPDQRRKKCYRYNSSLFDPSASILRVHDNWTLHLHWHDLLCGCPDNRRPHLHDQDQLPLPGPV